MSGLRDKAGQAKLFRQAMNGDRAAQARLVEMGLSKHREKVHNLRGVIDRYHRTEWDAEATRERVLEGEELAPEAVVDAFSRLHKKLLFLSGATFAMLTGDRDETSVWEEEIREEAFDLFIMLHNPTFRYKIVAGFRPAVREDVDDYIGRMSTTLWGTALALTSEGELDVDDLPPEVGPIVEHMAGYAEQQRQAGD